MVIKLNTGFLVLGETETTAYAGDKGKTAYDHSQAAHAPAGAEANVNADWNSESGDSQILNKPDITKPVGVTVYKSGSTYYAISSTGTTISSGTVVSTVIQAALDSLGSSGGSVYVSAGSYSILTGISIPALCSLILDKAAIILITTNINGFTLHNGSVLSGGTIDVTGVSGGYTANAITLDGNNRIRAEWPAGIHDIRINNDTYTGTAIYLQSTSTGSVAAGTSGGIYGTRITNIHINFFEYGIRTYLTGTTENFINGNLFENIWMIFPVHGIHMSSATNGYSSYDNNTFRNINIQPVNYNLPSNDPEYSGLSPSPTVTIKGRYNRFEDLAIWDWEASWGAHTEFTQYTQNNHVEIFDAYGSPNYALYTDAGINNILKFPHFDQDDYPYVRRRLNKVYGNIGVPTVEEMAVSEGQMSNLLRWTVPTTQESSTDGTTYTPSTALSAASLKTLMIGEGQGLSGSSANILTLTAGSAGYHRLTWDAATSDPLYLSKLYLYLSTSNLYATILVEKYSLTSEAWETVATGTVRNWPGHAYVPHDLILLSTTSNSSYHSKVRVTISATNTGGSTLYIRLYQLAWHGGFPVVSRSAIVYDGDKNATFPGGLTSTGVMKPQQATTAAAPTYVKGAIYFDTTMNKLRVGGASGWETINSS